MASGISAISVSPYYKFTDCCTNEEFNFRGSISGFINNSVYLALIDIGGIVNGRCYTVIQLTSQDSVFWNALPIIATANISSQGNTCAEVAEIGKCASCEEPCGECPEGYIQEGNECIKEETVPAIYTGGLVTITEGAKVKSYNKFGLRLYPDITLDIKPLLGIGNPYEVKANNGAGATIIPLIPGLQSTVWGCEVPVACSTFVLPTSNYGGRLNIAGIWAPGYNVEEGDGPELGFDFCVNITETKQYLIGIAGDNKVKLYVDGVLNVFLEPGGAGQTATFNYWHVFPITLTTGQHIIRLAGINIGNTQAAFAGEIYDIDIATFQANLTDPAVGVGNCGNTPADLEPYIVFTTRDFIGEDIPNPTQPGVWQCPDGSTPDYCTGIPECTIEEKIAFPICPCYLLLPCEEGLQPIISNTPELSNYLNGYVSILPPDAEEYICVYVADFAGEEVCETALEVEIDPLTECGCPPQCYYISGAEGVVYVSTDDQLIELTESETFPYIKICSKTYPLTSNVNENYQIVSFGNCEEDKCPVLCFKLVNCADENIVFYSNSDALLPYVYGTDNIVRVIGKEGCWKVSLTETNCNCLTVTISSDQISGNYTANATDTYNGYNVYEYQVGEETYYIWFSEKSGWVITQGGYGDNVDPPLLFVAESKFNGECPDSITEGFNWNYYISGDTLTTEQCPAECDCPIDVVVTSSYTTCEDCIGYIAYKLTSCTNNDVIYTLLNLEDYIGQVVKIDCGCYKVEQINYLPPNPQIIKLEDIFTNCIECTRTYWKLIDCLEQAEPIITYTDLSSYIGKTIKIKDCDECWTVEITTEHIGASVVLVTEEYIDCEDCGSNLPCQCSTITNYSEEVKTYTYLSCDKQYETITLQPHQTSDRICVLKWVPNDNCCIINTYTSNSEGESISFVWKYEETQEVINGKPVYEAYLVNGFGSRDIGFKLFYQNGCWYQFSNELDANIIPFKLCQDSDCPIGTWELLDCYCLEATVQGDQSGLFFNLYVSDIDQNGYYIYKGGQYTLSYNLELERWELYIEGSELVQAYLESTNPCPLSGGSRVTTFISVALDGTFIIENECKNETIVTNNTSSCGIECQCIYSTLTMVGDPYRFNQSAVLQPTGNIVNGKPEYFVQFYDQYRNLYIYWDPNTNCWILSTGTVNAKAAAPSILATLCNSINPNCPIGTWSIPTTARAKADASVLTITDFVTEYCTDGTSNNEEDPNTDPFTYIQFFGECQHGVCLPPVFKNNRTVRPGYNTPGCNPDEYDKITCKFATVYYKIALEKRYGITNCCPDEDEKWLLKKELIDLQALKDPNYKCPNCPCSCNSGKTYSSCNCGN